MIHVEDRELRRAVNAKLKESRQLTADERAALAEELAKPEYAGMSLEQKLDALNEWSSATREVVANKDAVEALAVMNALKNKRVSDGRSAWRHLCDMADGNADIWEAVDTIKNYSAAREVLSLNNPAVAAFVPALVQLGLMTEAEVAALTTERRVESYEVEPRAYALLGYGAMVERGDVA